MAQLRIQPKQPATSPWATAMTIVPIVAVLAVGALTTAVVQNGRDDAAEAIASLQPAVEAAQAWSRRFMLAASPVSFGGREWVPADLPAVTFDAREMVEVGTSGSHVLFANRVRGLSELSARPMPYDRPYVRLSANAYTPLRWRIVP